MKKSWIFLFIMLGIYLIFSIGNFEIFLNSIIYFKNIFIKLIPFLILVFILMFFINYFITPQFVKTHLIEKNKIKKWLYTIIFGIISTGPIYMWYPLLADLKDKGVDSGMIATFLYARAIKPALLPLMILYFGLTYTILFTIFIILFSLIQGLIINKMGV